MCPWIRTLFGFSRSTFPIWLISLSEDERSNLSKTWHWSGYILLKRLQCSSSSNNSNTPFVLTIPTLFKGPWNDSYKESGRGFGTYWHTFSLALQSFPWIWLSTTPSTLVGKYISVYPPEYIQFSHLPLLLILPVNPTFPSGPAQMLTHLYLFA